MQTLKLSSRERSMSKELKSKESSSSWLRQLRKHLLPNKLKLTDWPKRRQQLQQQQLRLKLRRRQPMPCSPCSNLRKLNQVKVPLQAEEDLLIDQPLNSAWTSVWENSCKGNSMPTVLVLPKQKKPLLIKLTQMLEKRRKKPRLPLAPQQRRLPRLRMLSVMLGLPQ